MHIINFEDNFKKKRKCNHHIKTKINIMRNKVAKIYTLDESKRPPRFQLVNNTIYEAYP